MNIEIFLKIKRNAELLHYIIDEMSKDINSHDELKNKMSSIFAKYNKQLSHMDSITTEFIQHIDKCLNEACLHEIEYDSIDIIPERTIQIKYCKQCFLTFDS